MCVTDLPEYILHPVNGAHAWSIRHGDMVRADPHNRAIVLMNTHILAVHVLLPDGAQLPQVGEAGDERAGDLSQPISISSQYKASQENGESRPPRVQLDLLPDTNDRVGKDTFRWGGAHVDLSILLFIIDQILGLFFRVWNRQSYILFELYMVITVFYSMPLHLSHVSHFPSVQN